MAYDAHKNFGYSVVSVAPSPAASGTSLTVATGEGTKFPTPPFNATVWPAGAQPSSANAEIVRVTNIVGDVLTITRIQESTSARTIVVGDQIDNSITAKVITDIENSIVITDAGLTLTDITTNNVTTAKHGFAPKAPNDVSKFLRGDATWAGVINPPLTITTTGTVNDWAPGIVSGAYNVIYCNNASLLTITGISATGIANGTIIALYNINAQVDLPYSNAGSLAANRFNNTATSGATSISSFGYAIYSYYGVSQKWALIGHDQGAAIDYSATTTLAGFATTPTKRLKYILRGRSLWIGWDFAGNPSGTAVSFTIPYQSTTAQNIPGGLTVDNTTPLTTACRADAAAGSTTINVFKDLAGNAWTNAGTRETSGTASFEVN